MAFCRICLSSDAPGLDVKQLRSSDILGNISYIKMIFFCLNIKVKEDEKTRKLCTICVDKLQHFYTFKSMALKNDEYLKSADPECIVNENKGLLMKKENDTTKFTVGNTLIRKVSCSSKKPSEIEFDNKNLSVKSDSDDDVIFDDSFSFGWNDEKETKKIRPNPRERQNVNIKSTVKQLQVAKKCKNKQIKIIKNNYGNQKVESTNIALSRSKRPIKKKPDNCIKCVDCKKEFSTQSSLCEHSCSREFILQCKICDIIFKTQPELYLHIIEHKKNEPRLLCHICSRGFHTKYAMECHLRRHMNIKPYKCSECAMSFISTSNLNRHKITHTDAQNFLHCNLCDRGFASKRYLERHQAVHDHTKRPEKKHQCTYCDKMLMSPYDRRKHEAIHTKYDS